MVAAVCNAGGLGSIGCAGVAPTTVRDQITALRQATNRPYNLNFFVHSHPRLDPDSSRVRFSGFGASSLDVELFVYVRTRDPNDFLAVREDLCLRVMDVVTAAGTAFAMPAQTNYSASAGIDPERAGAAAAEVQRWRTEGKLPLPEFPLKTRS